MRVVFEPVPADPDLVFRELSGQGSFVLVQVCSIEIEAVDLLLGILDGPATGPQQQGAYQTDPSGGDEELLLYALGERAAPFESAAPMQIVGRAGLWEARSGLVRSHT
jgi:hypothetical protein